jgi:hypothetical protein
MRSERGKMLAGELYDALDPELVAPAKSRSRLVPDAKCFARRGSKTGADGKSRAASLITTLAEWQQLLR